MTAWNHCSTRKGLPPAGVRHLVVRFSYRCYGHSNPLSTRSDPPQEQRLQNRSTPVLPRLRRLQGVYAEEIGGKWTTGWRNPCPLSAADVTFLCVFSHAGLRVDYTTRPWRIAKPPILFPELRETRASSWVPTMSPTRDGNGLIGDRKTGASGHSGQATSDTATACYGHPDWPRLHGGDRTHPWTLWIALAGPGDSMW